MRVKLEPRGTGAGGVREEVTLPWRHPLRPYRPTLVAPCGEPTHTHQQEVTKAPLGLL